MRRRLLRYLPAAAIIVGVGVMGCSRQAAPPAAEVKQASINVLSLAMGASVVGSSEFFASPNDPSVLLAPGEGAYAAALGAKMPQWIIFDLGAPRRVEMVSITWYDQANCGLDFRVLGRKDSREAWSTLAEATGNRKAVWEAKVSATEVGQVRLEVTKAAGQRRTLVKRFQLLAAEATPVSNVAVLGAGLKVDAASKFYPKPNDPSAIFTGRIGSPKSPDYAAASDGLPNQVTFSLSAPQAIRAVSVSWYDDQNYASQWELAAKQNNEWKPVLALSDQKERHGLYALPDPVTAQTFRLTVSKTVGQPRLLARQLALYAETKSAGTP